MNHTPTPFKEFKSYGHGSNESNYTPFVCACCGNEDKFGKIACLSCHKEIRNSVNAHEELVKALRDMVVYEGMDYNDDRRLKAVERAKDLLARIAQ